MPHQSQSPQPSPPHDERPQSSQTWFVRRVLIVVGVVVVVALLLTLCWVGADVLLLLFAGVLLAALLRGLADGISAHTPLSPNWALASVVLVLVGLAATGMWLLGTTLVQQLQQLNERLPQAIPQARQWLSQFSIGQQLIAQLPQPAQLLPQNTSVFTRVTGVVSSTIGVLTNVAIVLALGLYLAADPHTYTRGIVRLVPRQRRDRARAVIATLGSTLRWWLIGRFSVMTINGAITALGLWALGVPQPVLLGGLTGLLNFIPNIGPILAAVPALLLALPQGTTQVISVAILFVLVQNLEGFVLTPLVQQRTVSIPPALLLTMQVLLGVLFGFLGVLLAVPITSVVLVLIKLLYVEDTLGDHVVVAGEPEAQTASSS